MHGNLIMGADPGLIRTGLGVVEATDGRCVYVGSKIISPPANQPMASRLDRIFSETTRFIEKHQPKVMVVERLIYARNAQVAFKLGQARGVLLLAAERSGVSVVDYTPREVKLAVSGNGAASKIQVQRMVQAVLDLDELPSPHDISDALALSICHVHRQSFVN